jgi:hypothetical protein
VRARKRRRGVGTGADAAKRDCIMGRVPALVPDLSGAQLLDAPGEIHVFDRSFSGQVHRHATRSPERRDL